MSLSCPAVGCTPLYACRRAVCSHKSTANCTCTCTNASIVCANGDKSRCAFWDIFRSAVSYARQGICMHVKSYPCDYSYMHKARSRGMMPTGETCALCKCASSLLHRATAEAGKAEQKTRFESRSAAAAHIL